MIFQPSDVLPSFYMNDGDGIIDATKDNVFSATIKGQSPVVAYQCGIFKNNATSDLVYDTGVVELEKPFYGADSVGNIIPFEYTIPSNDVSKAKHTSIENGYVYGYKYILTLWWDIDKTDYSKYCVSSYEYVFFAKATPVVSISEFGSGVNEDNLPIVNARSCIWNGTYYQDNNVGAAWFQWTLASYPDRTIITQTEKIYSHSAIQFLYDGLTTDTKYSIKLDVQTQDGVLVSSGWVDFITEYLFIDIGSVVEVTPGPFCSNYIDWGKIQYIEGVPNNYNWLYNNDVPVKGNNSAKIMRGTRIDFSSSEHFELNIPIDGEILYSFHVPEDSESILRGSGTDDDGNDYYFNLSHVGTIPGLAPNKSLVPSQSLVPVPGNPGMFILDVNGEMTYAIESGFIAITWNIMQLTKDYLELYDTLYIPSAVVNE